MKRTQDKFFSWRLKLILFLGCLGGLAVGLFSQYVARMSDVPIGPTPLSWKFKSNSARVAVAFETELVMNIENQSTEPELPLLDQNVPEKTEFALFALG